MAEDEARNLEVLVASPSNLIQVGYSRISQSCLYAWHCFAIRFLIRAG